MDIRFTEHDQSTVRIIQGQTLSHKGIAKWLIDPDDRRFYVYLERIS